MESFQNLEVPKIWEYFWDICRIPRPSKSEERIIEYIMNFASGNDLDSEVDDAGNVLIRKPAYPGMENSKMVILQSHLDMVGEKEPSSDHDFNNDPIIPVIDGDWIRAEGTTLGADCGIGIAVQLAILEDDELKHGPLECLFTVDEESGMSGARLLDPDLMKGKVLLNLDSEDWGELFIGCAGGIDTVGTFRFSTEKVPSGAVACKVEVGGLKGGHSGDEIHKSPGNSIKVINRFLNHASDEYNIRLACFDGGNMRNAIPRDAYAVFTVSAGSLSDLQEFFDRFSESIKMELADYEPDMTLEFIEAEMPQVVIAEGMQKTFLKTISCIPHGVVSWSQTLEGLVETSTNLASVKFPQTDTSIITTSQRSSLESGKKIIAERIEDCLKKGDAEVEHSDGYPGWNPDPDSEVLRITVNAYEEMFGEKPIVRAIHAGLECGLILEKYPELDMLSFGPTIKGAHTPAERIDIDTTVKFWGLLLDVLGRIPQA